MSTSNCSRCGGDMHDKDLWDHDRRSRLAHEHNEPSPPVLCMGCAAELVLDSIRRITKEVQGSVFDQAAYSDAYQATTR